MISAQELSDALAESGITVSQATLKQLIAKEASSQQPDQEPMLTEANFAVSATSVVVATVLVPRPSFSLVARMLVGAGEASLCSRRERRTPRPYCFASPFSPRGSRIDRSSVQAARPAVQEVLRRGLQSETIHLSQLEEALTDMQFSFRMRNRFRQLAMLVIARTTPVSELQGLRELFERLDVDNSGWLSLEELRRGLEAIDGKVHAHSGIPNCLRLCMQSLLATTMTESATVTIEVTSAERLPNSSEAVRHSACKRWPNNCLVTHA